MIHERVDVEHWTSAFPLERLRAEAQVRAMEVLGLQTDQLNDEAVADEALPYEPLPAAGSITSPYHLAILEQVREEAKRLLRSGRRVATDIFIFALGEPNRRDVTKTGGLPYWPVGQPWPHSEDEPAIFLAQLSFVDSQDLVSDLPGDLLLVFAHRAWLEPQEWDGWWPELIFEWQTLGDMPLIVAEDIPTLGAAVLPCFGAIHRSADFPDAVGDLNQVPRWKNGAVFNATKIGGVPVGGGSAYFSNARYIGSIGSIDPVFCRPWPFLNYEEPMATVRQSMQWHNRLSWRDLGRLDLWFDDQRVLYRVDDS